MLRCLVLAIFSGASLFAQTPRFTVHDLGPLNKGVVTGINVRGQVIGYETQSDGHVRGFRTATNAAIDWSTDDLGSLGGTTTLPHGINAIGQVVGESTLSSGETRAFRTSANKSIQPSTDNLETLGGADSQALAINDSGQVTGRSGRPFLTAPNKAIDPATDLIDATQGIYHADGAGRYINRQGHVLGEVWAGAPFYPTAFLTMDRTGPVTLQNIIRFVWQDFAGITDQDQIVFGDYHALSLWQNGKTTKLADCPTCVPLSINNSLQVVGSTITNQFLYTNGVVYDLATVLPDGSAWTMPNTSSGPSPIYINDLGQIAGVATFNNETHAFRLDPVLSVGNAIEKALKLLSTIRPNADRRSTLMMTTKATLESRLSDALDSWGRGNSAATRGLLNEFETLVRAQVGETLTNEQANQLIQMAEAAFALT